MGKPAARVGDMTAHGGMITGPGVPNVLIGGMPAATMGDMHVCPMVTPGVTPVPHVGGPLVGPVPPTVLIGGKPADRKSTRLNSSHVRISYAVFCLKKKIKSSTSTS